MPNKTENMHGDSSQPEKTTISGQNHEEELLSLRAELQMVREALGQTEQQLKEAREELKGYKTGVVASTNGEVVEPFPLYQDTLFTLIENMPIIVFKGNERAGYTEVFGPAVQYMGLTHEDFIGKKVADIFPQAVQTLEQALKTGRPCSCRVDGETGGRSWYFDILFLPDKDCSDGFIGCAREAGSYRKIENDLNNLTALLEESIDFIAVADLTGQLLYLNKSFRDAIHFTGDVDPATVNMFSLFEDHDVALLRHTALPHAAQEDSWSGELTIVIGDQKIPVLQQIIIHKNAQGVPLFFSTVMRDITRRRDALETLRTVEERWKFAFEGTGDGVWDWDVVTDELFFSSRWKEMLGYEEDEIGNTIEEWSSRLHPDIYDRAMQELDDYFGGKTSVYESEQLLRCKDGSYKWVLDRAKVVAWSPEGAPLRMVGTATDITERKRAEEKLRRSESRFRTMSDASPLGIFVASPAGFCEYTNPAYHRISGLDFEETLGDGWSVAVYSEDREWVLREWQSAIANKTSFEGLVRYYRPDTGIVWASVKAGPMWDGEKLLGYVGTIEDITSRKIAEEELQQREEFLRETGRIANVGGWEMNIQTYQITWSEQVFHIHEMEVGPSPDLSKALSFYSDKTRSFLEKILQRTVDTGEAHDIEVPFITARGSHRWARIIGRVHFYDGQPVKIIGTIQDITDRKMAEEVIRYKNQMLNGILANMPVVAYRIDKRNRFSEIRGSAMQRFDAGGESLIGQPASEFFSQIVPDIEKARSGDVAATEYRGGESSSPWYFQNYLFPDMFHEGHLIGFALDITERVVVEEELRRSQANLAAVFDSTTDSIWAIDLDYRVIAYNTSFANYCHVIHNKDVFIGIPISTFMSEEREAVWLQLYDRAFAGEIFSIESDTLIRGEKAYFEVNFNPVKDGDRIIGIVMFSKNVTERKRTEETLKENLATLNAVLESTDNSIFAIDIQHRYMAFNSQFKTAMQKGYGLDIEVGMNALELMKRGPDGEKAVQHLERAIHQGPFSIVEEFGNPDLSRGYFELSYNPIKTDTGEVLGIAIYSQDITERKNAEEELRRTMVLQQAIMDAADVSIISAGIEGTIVTFNKAAERMLGYTAEEVIGRATPAIFHDFEEVVQQAKKLTNELGDPVEPGFDAFVAKARLGYADENEWTYIRKDSSRFPVLLSVTALHDSDNNLTGFLGIGVDITERKQAEQLLLKIQDDLLEAQRIAKVGSFEVEAASQYGVWTKQAALIYGCDENTSMAEVDFRKFIHPDDIDIVLADWYATCENGTVISRDFRIVREDGRAVSINVFGKPVFDEDGKVVSIKGTIQDITERKEHESELIAARDAANSANRAKSEFLANMSHEIRTPMNSVLGFTELLRNLIKDDQQISYLQAITTSGKMLLRLINDILDLSKVEAGRLDFRYELEDIGLLIEETRQIFAIRIQEKKLDFFIDNNVRLPFVLDAARLRQILLNLVGNAVKFTDKGYVRIIVRMAINSDGVRVLRIAVEDSGIGIPESQQAMIFEAFRQQDGQSTRRYGGTGLGLTITKRLAEAMNGTISVRSTVGTGSVFEVILPEAVPSSMGSPVHDTAYDATIGFENSLLMVVDDNDLNRELVREMLQGSELRLLEAPTGVEAIQVAAKYLPDMILMDLHLPDINGDIAVDRIRTLPGLECVPVVFLTASAMKEDAPVGTTLARETYLYKPVTKKELIRTLALFLPHSTGTEHPPLPLEPDNSSPIEFPLHELSAEIHQILPNLLAELREQYMPVWRELNEAPILHEVEQFAQELCNLGEHYNIAMIQRYGELLGEQVKMVNVVDFPVTLAKFPALVKSVKDAISR